MKRSYKGVKEPSIDLLIGVSRFSILNLLSASYTMHVVKRQYGQSYAQFSTFCYRRELLVSQKEAVQEKSGW